MVTVKVIRSADFPKIKVVKAVEKISELIRTLNNPAISLTFIHKSDFEWILNTPDVLNVVLLGTYTLTKCELIMCDLCCMLSCSTSEACWPFVVQ